MGLYVSHLKELPYHERSLYIYLLDYGWPDGPYERVFRENFPAISQRASETGSIVIAGHRGVHFANEVLSWHNVNGVDADTILPAMLITKTHPSYFGEIGSDLSIIDDQLTDLVLIPLKPLCTSPDDFASIIGSVFSDLERGLEIQKFQVSKNQYPQNKIETGFFRSIGQRIVKSIVLQPNIAGLGVDLKALLEGSK